MFCQCTRYCTAKADLPLEIDGKLVPVKAAHVNVEEIFTWGKYGMIVKVDLTQR